MLSRLIVAFLAAAASVQSSSGNEIQALSQVATFDDIAGVNPVLGFAPPTPYKHLTYTAFGLGAPAPGSLTIQASSPDNAVFAPYITTGLLTQPAIGTGKDTLSFDMKSIANGCYAATENGALAPAIDCTIRYTGFKAGSEEKVTHDYVYETCAVLDILGVALQSAQVKTTRFPPSFSNLEKIEPEVLTAALPAVQGVTVQMAFDDVAYVANVQKAE
ncbi:hypothetical protein KC367_g8476 [Hortaea werneckii]|nr:hypothetical protein KC367_g8476 [Hortaea werneckii]